MEIISRSVQDGYYEQIVFTSDTNSAKQTINHLTCAEPEPRKSINGNLTFLFADALLASSYVFKSTQVCVLGF